MADNTKGRRDFMGMALGGFTALGGIGALYAMKRTWDPLPSVKAAGFTTLNMKDYKDNELVVEKWRGKPIFVLKQSPETVEKLKKEMHEFMERIAAEKTSCEINNGVNNHA
jgi:ubiquinol-cytochrome c reductase iron-sulfur subunit